ncbi:MAG: hypothetical protein ACT4PU_11525 [Planctomycetota bacterium]
MHSTGWNGLSLGFSALLVLAALSAGGRAQESNIDPALKHAWGENVGWTNWHDAAGAAQGVVVNLRWLEGFAWGENIGWINLGNGSPTNGFAYANTDGSDVGVNLDYATGFLSGLAWGENVGWINFNTGALGADRARYDPSTHTFAGYAWGENIGWLNLGDGTQTLAVFNPATDLGFAKPGTGGLVPEFRFHGLLSSGNDFVVSLRKALPNTLTAWYVGLTATPTAFKDGTLVPLPTLLTVFIFTDSSGMAAFQSPGGTGSIPVDIYVQAAIADAGATFGVSVSNAVAAHFQP